MDTALKNKVEALLGESFLNKPVRPGSQECCGNDCGDVCIRTVYWTEEAHYGARWRKLKEAGWSDDEDNEKAI